MKRSISRSGERVLDVAAGNGNATLAAARRFARVTSTDYVPALLERRTPPRRSGGTRRHVRSRRRRGAALSGRELRRRALDLRRHVCAGPRRRRRARLLRVCRPGGRIGLASWTPEGSSASSFESWPGTCRRLPGVQLAAPVGHPRPPPGACLPVRRRSSTPSRTSRSAIESAEHFVDVFRTFYGPVHKAFAALDANGQAALEADLLALLRKRAIAAARRPRRAGRVPGDGHHPVRRCD